MFRLLIIESHSKASRRAITEFYRGKRKKRRVRRIKMLSKESGKKR